MQAIATTKQEYIKCYKQQIQTVAYKQHNFIHIKTRVMQTNTIIIKSKANILRGDC